jgi:SAM-dependent methyltransferase
MTKDRSTVGFGDVDRDPSRFVAYLDHLGASSQVREHQREFIEMVRPTPGDRLLEVGCGLGQDAVELASRIGSDGHVVGIDNSNAMLVEARAMAAARGCSVEYLLADAHALAFADATFDACRAIRVLQHLEDPQRAVEEMIRVLKPGGRMVLVDPDWETAIVDADDRELTRRILNIGCDRTLRNGWMGRRLPGILRGRGMIDLEIHGRVGTSTSWDEAKINYAIEDALLAAIEACVVSDADAQAWRSQMEERARAGLFFAAVTSIAVFARKPS